MVRDRIRDLSKGGGLLRCPVFASVSTFLFLSDVVQVPLRPGTGGVYLRLGPQGGYRLPGKEEGPWWPVSSSSGVSSLLRRPCEWTPRHPGPVRVP